VFRDGSRQAYAAGNAVDFVTYPVGKSSADVVAVEPHRGKEENPHSDPARYAWCLHGRGASTTVSKHWTG
jgi:hypothetical protein